jgi:diguanylate cyclase (GGDEF)-like protein/PAS domain S-box-containing protein
MEQKLLKVLIVDDDRDDYLIIKDLLKESVEVQFQLDWISTYEEALKTIPKSDHDIYIYDYRLGAYNGIDLLKETIRLGNRTPVILLTGQKEYEIDMEAIKSGAADYLIKDEISYHLLERSIRYAIERKRIEDELFQEKELAQVTLKSIGDSVITIDINGNINYLNPAAEQLTGWSLGEAAGLPFRSLINIINENTRQQIDFSLFEVSRFAIEHKHEFSSQNVLINRHGHEFAIETTVSPIRNREEQIIGVAIVFHDVTETREMAIKIVYQASHDSLTGIINRSKFEEIMQQLLEKNKYQPQHHVLFFMDLDRFKIINDTCGHFAGDQLLKQIAQLLREKLRASDVLARLGGDEFGVLLENCPLEKASEIAEKLCKTVSEFPFIWNNKLFNIGISIGVIGIDSDQDNADYILSAADEACYLAKEKGGSRFHIFSDYEQEFSKRIGDTQWVSRISKSFEENKFHLYCQQIIPLLEDAQPGDHYELLLRMEGEEKNNFIYPAFFIPAAQRYNLMPTIDRWVINNFIAFYKNNYLNTTSKTLFTCNINLSGASLNDDSFPQFVEEQLRENLVPAHLICFEITETVAIANFTKATQFIQGLRSLGCRFALDDFGSGFSSFGYLKHLPVDYLKIDGSFVKNMVNNSFDLAMVRSINEMGHLMGLKTIAEFVENESIFNLLKTIGVDYAQGYWVANPKPLHDAELGFI